ncbi:MAG: FAD binding domain-containing protein, partial [Syntrophorhabdales bacterium]
RLVRPEALLDLYHLRPQLSYITEEGGNIRIGALTPLSTLEADPLLHNYFPSLPAAIGGVASVQIRNSATIGGNLLLDTRCHYYNYANLPGIEIWETCVKKKGALCHVSNKRDGVCFSVYSGDLAALLIPMGARVRLASSQGERSLLVEGLYSGLGQSPFTLAPDELLIEVELPIPQVGSVATYRKFRLQDVDYPMAGIGVVLRGDGEWGPGTPIESAGIALTAVGTAPLKVEEAERLLRGELLTPELTEQVAELCVKQARFFTNVHLNPTARRAALRTLVRQSLTDLMAAKHKEEV